MHKAITLCLLSATFAFGNASAATEKAAAMKSASAPVASATTEKPVGKQQGKMARCNADAKANSLKGDERKKFMSSCLSA